MNQPLIARTTPIPLREPDPIRIQLEQQAAEKAQADLKAERAAADARIKADHAVIIARLKTEFDAAVAEKDRIIADLRDKIAKSKNSKSAELSAARSKAAALKRDLAESRMFDSRKIGVARVSYHQPEPESPRRLLERYEATPSPKDRDAMRKAHLAELRAAYAARLAEEKSVGEISV